MKIVEKKDCSGCSACFNICPKKAITMIPDENGFKYPNIDLNLCVHCNLCKKVCPILTNTKIEKKIHAYACINNNKNVRLNSSSGGIFYLLAENVIKKGGIVFGAKFNDKLKVEHDYIDKLDDINKFQGSKYVQSTINDSYKKVKAFLENGRLVLFTGTPCQIEGLFCYLQKTYSNLITQDIICHGTPSPKVFEIYKKYLEKKYNDKIVSVNFRKKTNGWKDFSITVGFENNYYEQSHSKDCYMQAFLNNISLRESCYQWHSKKKYRLSDITLADFWGIENILPDIDDDFGTSLVITNSTIGEKIFSEISNSLKFSEVDYDEATKYNIAATQSVYKPIKRKFYLKKVSFENINTITASYSKMTFMEKIYRKFKKVWASGK